MTGAVVHAAQFDAGPRPVRILRRPEVEIRTGLSRSALYALMSKHEFPSAIPLGLKSVGWLESSVESWIAGRAAIAVQQGGRP